MRVDTNTNGHRQWFYFSVRNLVAGAVKFNVYRFKKKFSLFQRGMKPYVRSMKSNDGWKPANGKISYRLQKQNDGKSGNESATYFLTFQYKFQHAEDEVYFASGIPYPVSFLNQRLNQFSNCSQQLIQFNISTICKTLCGQDLKIISIQPKIKRPSSNYIIINARTHAGQTSSSWVLDGFLEKLTKDQNMHKWINQNNISFKIMPMLNPDGVFVGNYRTGILGEDFNRKFATDKKELFPQIMAIRKIVSDCKRLGRVLMFIDLHGHSVLKNSFIYGPAESLYIQHPLRNLPFAIWHNSKYFRLSSCKFKFNKDMSETARIYFQIKQNILAYTCQISLGLFLQGTTTFQMLEDDYKSLGSSILQSIIQQLTPQKLQQFNTFLAQNNKLSQTTQLQNVNKLTAKQFSGRKEVKQLIKQNTAKQKQRQTCLQKINNIKKQLNLQNTNQKSQKVSISPQKSYKIMNSSLRRNQAFEMNYSIDSKAKRKETNKNSNISLLPTRKSTLDKIDLDGQLGTEEDQSPVKIAKIDQKKHNREAQFKIRRKSDMMKVLPESIRKKLGPKIELGFTSTKYLANQPDDGYKLERSATYDATYLSTQIELANNQTSINQLSVSDNLEIVNQKFSEEYQSINDSDNSSQDLEFKEKQYLVQFIKSTKKAKTNNQPDGNGQEHVETEEAIGSCSTTVNINGFKQIRFVKAGLDEQALKTMVPLRNTKRQVHKYRDLTYKSLGRTQLDEQCNMMPQMIQKKHLNERTNKKSVRQPYFLVQIRSKNH